MSHFGLMYLNIENGREIMAGKTFGANFNASTERTFAAGVRAVGELGYTILEARPDAGVISFNSGRSMKSWAGQDMSATFVNDGPGTKVIVGGSIAKGGNPLGGGSQIVSWGEKTQIAERFLRKLEDVLPQTPEPKAKSNSGGGSLADQFRSLADLKDQGVLSETEFEAAKAKIIG
jgi:hypothetical protein